MTISKKQLLEARQESYKLGQESGRCLGREEQKALLASDKLQAMTAAMKAAAELANANAKLTYAMSRMITGGN